MRVTIEGSILPSTHIATGERRTVERTPFIDKLIRKGFVTVVEEFPEPEPQHTPASKRVSRPAAEKDSDTTREAGVPRTPMNDG